MGARNKRLAKCSAWFWRCRMSRRTPQVSRRLGSDGEGWWRNLRAGTGFGGRPLVKSLPDPLG